MTWLLTTDTVHRMCTTHLASSCQVRLQQPLGTDPPRAMDFGLGLVDEERERPAKRAAVGVAPKDMINIIGTIGKLSLNSAQQTRALKNILIDVFRVPTDFPMAAAMRAATKGFVEAAQRIVDPVARTERLGVPHVHAWNACIKTYKLALEASSAQADKDTLGEIVQYIGMKNKEGWKGVASEVTYARVRKNYNKDFVCLEFNVRDATASRPLYESMKKWINTLPDTSELPGVAPPGDLERKVQQWPVENGMSAPQSSDA